MEAALVYVLLSQKDDFQKGCSSFCSSSIIRSCFQSWFCGLMRLSLLQTLAFILEVGFCVCCLSFLFSLHVFFCPYRWVFKCFGRVGLSELQLSESPFSLHLCLLSSFSASARFHFLWSWERKWRTSHFAPVKERYTIRHRNSTDFCRSGLNHTTINLGTDTKNIQNNKGSSGEPDSSIFRLGQSQHLQHRFEGNTNNIT